MEDHSGDVQRPPRIEPPEPPPQQRASNRRSNLAHRLARANAADIDEIIQGGVLGIGAWLSVRVATWVHNGGDGESWYDELARILDDIARRRKLPRDDREFLRSPGAYFKACVENWGIPGVEPRRPRG